MLCPTKPIRKTITENCSVYVPQFTSVRIQILMQIKLVVRNRFRLQITIYIIFVDPDPER
jgi:hypothetical protein